MGTFYSVNTKFSSEYKDIKSTLSSLGVVKRIRTKSIEYTENTEKLFENIASSIKTKMSSHIDRKKRSKTTKSYKFKIYNSKYLKKETEIPINEFFYKFFKLTERKKGKILNEELFFNNSDLYFSDLDSLKIIPDIETLIANRKHTSSTSSINEKIKHGSLKERQEDILNNYSNNSLKRAKKIYKEDQFFKEFAEIENADTTHNSCNLEPFLLISRSESQNKKEISISSNSKLNSKPEDFRSKYFTKLALNNILPTKKTSPLENNIIFIFDWDDTLFCTHHLSVSKGILRQNYYKMSENDLKIFKNLEEEVLQILNFAIRRGHCYIITNALDGWVEFSAKKFYPRVFPLLQKIKVISARGEYEKLFPKECKKWKNMAFLNISQVLNTNALTNIISLGDSFNEIDSSILLSSKFENSFLKTIKFRENPSPKELLKELKLVRSKMDIIFSSIKHLNINVNKKEKNMKKEKNIGDKV